MLEINETHFEEMAKVPVGEISFPCGILHSKQRLPFEGACGKPVDFFDAYRCSDCQAYFHRDCARVHFKQKPIDQVLREMDEWQRDVERLAKDEDAAMMLIGIVNAVIEARVAKGLKAKK